MAEEHHVSPKEELADRIRITILESGCGATTADAIAALDQIKEELTVIVFGATYASKMMQDYKVDVHGGIIEKD